jgi:hypothetical protein
MRLDGVPNSEVDVMPVPCQASRKERRLGRSSISLHAGLRGIETNFKRQTLKFFGDDNVDVDERPFLSRSHMKFVFGELQPMKQGHGSEI